ncbi:YhgE/Pip domain-containing protein [Actinomadura parmotrematis]|uniref:YhgE/Pip domain-containing protein n=1 Tax=Actinomadura parmotrematis TaxID=2864039 RepID=A0ABS7G7H7_9ACTN|nr:YhgE/Pip domain-containing protein [Actinomadura parmotrematis]MBW8487583.1 YhgE/Pip domain-containing protein [Actinomadura parmotrematis]
MRLPALSAGGLELRRFTRHRLTRVALVALVFLPLLYSGLYLASFWDPYGRLGHVPVALVNEDRPATAGGKEVHAGRDLADELERREVFGWKRVDEAAAERGVREGRYYMVLTIPRDFSAAIASPSGAGAPTAARLRLRLDDSNNYVIGTLAQSVFKEISAAAGGDAVRGYFDSIFVSFGQLHGKLDEAAQGAGELADGSGQAEDGAGRLAGGLDRARAGSAQVTGGLGTLQEKTDELDAGGKRLAAGVQRLTTVVDGTADQVVPLLRRYAPDVRDAALLVARAADGLADGADGLPARTRAAVQRAEQARLRLKAELALNPAVPQAVKDELDRSAAQVVAVAKQVDGYVRDHAGDLTRLAADARAVEKAAKRIAAEAPGLAGRIEKARGQVDELNAGARRLSGGIGLLSAGTGRLADGSARVTSGLGTLSEGAVTLRTALLQISEGSGELASGLRDGAGRVPDYSEDERAQRADVMSAPVRLDGSVANKAPNYGTGFAPFFVPLSLWVGAMIVYMLLRPLNPRAVAANAPGLRVALAGWLPAAAIGAAQVGAVLAVLHFGLGLQARHWPGLVAFLMLAAAADMAVVQWVNARFGPAGRIVALALLMLQLTSAAGTYPIETSPAFFGAIRPYLPMSWVVDGARRLISGGDLAPVWQGGAVLALFLAGGLALTSLAVRRARTWTVERLHPVLRL